MRVGCTGGALCQMIDDIYERQGAPPRARAQLPRPHMWPHMGAHDLCRPGQCMRILQPAEQPRAFQLQLQTVLQTSLPSSRWEMACPRWEMASEMAAGEVCSVAAGSTW